MHSRTTRPCWGGLLGRSHAAVLALLAVLAVGAIAAPADAQRRRQNRNQEPANEDGPPPPTLADLDTIAPRLQSENPDEVREAIDQLSVIDHPSVIPHLAAALREGQPDAITDRALEALGALAHADAIEVLAEFTHHRRAGARRRAYQALAGISDRRVPPILETGLSDSDRGIRGAVALSLGEMGARDSIDVLFRAFERGVVEAATAIGKLGNRQSVTRFTEYLGQRPLAIMLSGYHEFLRRDDMSNEVKTEIVAQLGEVSGPMVRRFLQEYLGTFRERDRSALKRHVEETLRRIPADGAGVRVGTGANAAEEGGEQ